MTTYVVVMIINQWYLHHYLHVRLSNIFRHLIESYAKVFSTGVKVLRHAFR